MLGFEVAQSTVSKYMVRRRNPPSQSWKTFLRNNGEAIAAVDMCVVPTVNFELLFAFLVLGHGRRHLLWFEVTRYPTAEWLARQITEAFPWASAPTYLVRDNDRAYGLVFQRRVRAMGIRDRPISPSSPWQNGIAERLIGTLRRECLDQMLIFGEAHLRRILSAYATYYNQARTHVALQKDAPQYRAVQRNGTIIAIPVLSGLHHRYARRHILGVQNLRAPEEVRLPSPNPKLEHLVGLKMRFLIRGHAHRLESRPGASCRSRLRRPSWPRCLVLSLRKPPDGAAGYGESQREEYGSGPKDQKRPGIGRRLMASPNRPKSS